MPEVDVFLECLNHRGGVNPQHPGGLPNLTTIHGPFTHGWFDFRDLTSIRIVEDERGAGTIHIPATISLLTFTTVAVLDHSRRGAIVDNRAVLKPSGTHQLDGPCHLGSLHRSRTLPHGGFANLIMKLAFDLASLQIIEFLLDTGVLRV